MSIRSSLLLPTTFTLLCFVSFAQAVTMQGPGDVLPDGSAFLFVEAEDFSELGGDEATGFLTVDNINPIQSVAEVKGGLDILPADTNASRGAGILDQLGGGNHAGTATWELQFAIPATYYLYLHASMYNSDNNTSYGNEDSIFLPPSFNANTNDDWIGFEGVDQDGNDVTGDSVRDGWMPIFNNKVVVSAGATEVHNDTNEDFWDGQFHWMFADFGIDVDADNSYIDDFGIAIKYEVSEADVGTVQTYQISSREAYGVIDTLVFSTSDQLLQNFTQDELDEFFLNRGAPTVLQPGDANQDLEFNFDDILAVLAVGKFETGNAATWAEGDWNGAPGGSPGDPPLGDGLFDFDDILAALAAGKYETGPYAEAAITPGNDGDGKVKVWYDATTGEVSIGAEGNTLSGIQIVSESAIFTGDPAENLGGPFDVDRDDKIAKAVFGESFGDISFGNVAQAGHSEAEIAADFTATGTLFPSGALGEGDIDLIWIPEPSSLVLFSLGLLALGWRPRRTG